MTDDTRSSQASPDDRLRVTVRAATIESMLADATAEPELASEEAPEGEATEGEAEEAPQSSANGLARLVLSLVNLLHDLLEKQAIRRMNNGTLTDEEVERVGRTLQKQAQEIDALCDAFDLDPSDLSLPLGTVETHDIQ